MMSYALQVFVRGFEDQGRAAVIRDLLTEIGFEIEASIDGRSDSLGGIIETNIVCEDDLIETDPKAMLENLREQIGYDGIWLQTREYQAQDGEYGRDTEDEEDDED